MANEKLDRELSINDMGDVLKASQQIVQEVVNDRRLSAKERMSIVSAHVANDTRANATNIRKMQLAIRMGLEQKKTLKQLGFESND
jgi:hypothetical protein